MNKAFRAHPSQKIIISEMVVFPLSPIICPFFSLYSRLFGKKRKDSILKYQQLSVLLYSGFAFACSMMHAPDKKWYL
jgi:hypothetical protein